MAVWKPKLEGRHPSHNIEGVTEDDLRWALDRLTADPKNTDLRRELGETMEALGLDRFQGWLLEFRVENARVIDREAAESWWGKELPTGRRASQMIASMLEDYFSAHEYERSAVAGLEWDVVWTVRPT